MRTRQRNYHFLDAIIACALVCSAWISSADTPPQNAPEDGVRSPKSAPPPPPRPNGSLWSAGNRSLVSDVRAFKAGDTITIIVQEAATATSSASTKTSRNDSLNFDGASGSLAGILGHLGLTKGLLSPFGVSGKTSTDGQGQTSRSGTLVAKLTVMVKEVLPNGNLAVEGSRVVGVNAEKQKIVISGIIRPQDVGPDNTVSSVALANAQVQFDGKGPVADKQRRGLITTILGWLF